MVVTPLRQPASESDAASTGTTSEDGGKPDAKAPRGQSTIAFPYADLSDALAIATTIRDRGGAPIAKDQLASAMGQAASSGAFSAKLHAARMFGLVKFIAGKIKLSDLAYEAIDADVVRSKAAKVTAFLAVPLFARTYDEFRNRQLPLRPHGLERAFVEFGVLEKRKTNARWTFDRSARQAGFFQNGDDRLVAPIIVSPQSLDTRTVAEACIPPLPTIKTNINEFVPIAAQQPLIKGLLERVPEPNIQWPINERVRWLRVLSANLAMIYGDKDEGDISIQAPPRRPTPAEVTLKPQAPMPPSGTAGKGDLDDEIPF